MPRSPESPFEDSTQLAYEAMRHEIPEGLVDGPLLRADHEAGIVIWKGKGGVIDVYRTPRPTGDTISFVGDLHPVIEVEETIDSLSNIAIPSTVNGKPTSNEIT